MTRKLHLLLSLLLPCFFVVAQPTKAVNTFAEQMPYFMGCSDMENGTAEKRQCSNQNLIEFISRNVNYPEAARAEGIEGTVYVKFVVNTFGEIENAEVLRDIGGDCGKEALRIVGLMPAWEPAISEERAIAISLNLPVTFSLQDEDYLVKSKYQIQWGSLRGERTSKEELKNHVSKKLFVRDELGNNVNLSSLTFIFQRKRSYVEQTSTGRINSKMEKLIKRVRKGGVFMIVAVVQREGKAYEIVREFEVVE